MRKTIAGIVLAALIPVGAFGQGARPVLSEAEGTASDLSKGFSTGSQALLGGLVDPTKFSMSHGYSMSFASSGGAGGFQGLYLNTMRYRLAPPVSLTVQMGYRYGNAGILSGVRGTSVGGQVVVPRVELTYRPSRNFSLSIQYSNFPQRYYDPLGRWEYPGHDRFFGD